jgi:hypothetical protein
VSNQEDPDALSACDLERIWREKVRPRVFGGHQSDPGRPVLLALGGQTGAGKTVGMHQVLDLYAGCDVVPIIGDDLRIDHPRYSEIMATDDLAMPEATGPASAAWIRMALDHARAQRYSCLVEGTFRSPQTTLGTVREFAAAGYHVHIVALAVPGPVSWLSCLARYHGARAAGSPGRWITPASHQAGYDGTPTTVDAAELDSAVHRLSIIDRAGALLYDNTRAADSDPASWREPTGAAAVLIAARERQWTQAEALSFLTRLRQLARVLGPEAREDLNDVAALAERYLPPGAQAAALADAARPDSTRAPGRSGIAPGQPPRPHSPRPPERRDGIDESR